MSTLVQEQPRVGNSGGLQDLFPPDEKLVDLRDRSPEPSRTGIWVGLAAITMTFAVFTSAMIVSQGSAVNWLHIPILRIFFVNTFVLMVSSVTLEIARRRVAAFARGQNSTRSIPMTWLFATLILGLLFVAGQYLGWLRLRSAGLYLATNLSSSFFYVFTVAHAMHVLGGLMALIVVIRRLSQPVLSLRKSTLDSTSYYWHFMGILWLYLLSVLWMKL